MKGYSLTSISLVYKYTFSLLLDGSGIYKIGAILAPLTTAISFLYQSFVQLGQNVYEVHTGRNRFNLFQISFSGNTEDAHPGVSGVTKDQKFCEKFKNTHCQVDHPAKIE